jgi:hypothetical protein
MEWGWDRMEAVAAAITAIAAVAALLTGYVQYVIRRTILPWVEFDVDFTLLPGGAVDRIGEIVCTVRNVGPGAGYVANVQGRVRYRLPHDTGLARDGVEPAFPNRVSANPPPEPSSLILRGGFLFAPDWEPAFIQPDVTHWYRKPVTIPPDAVLVHVWAAFEYRIVVGPISRRLAWTILPPAERREVLAYTVRRTFAVEPRSG